MDFDILHGFGSNPVPSADKNSLLDGYNLTIPLMPNKLGYQAVNGTPTPITRADVSVLGVANTTSSNARPQRLPNGWIVTVEADGANTLYYQVSKDKGATFSPLCTTSASVSITSFSVVSYGTFIYTIFISSTNGTSWMLGFDASTVTNTLQTPSAFDSNQGSYGNGCHLMVNSAKTYIYACWTSKNASYPNSFNIRYRKGAISAVDGSVSWVAVEQVTGANGSGYNFANPTISYVDSTKPLIIADYSGTGSYFILALGGSIATIANSGGLWNNAYVYSNASYAQTNASSIFVPQSVNGLASGRIWCSWQGTDSTDTTITNIRVSYSDNLGVTWSAMQKLTTGSTQTCTSPSVTANSANEIFIVFIKDIPQMHVCSLKYNGSSWAFTQHTTFVGGYNANYPSAVFDVTLAFTVPLFIYRFSFNKIGFYGTWTDITITESINYSLVSLKTLVQTINTNGAVGGKRWATGSATSSAGGTINITGLAFNPSIVLAKWNTDVGYSSVYADKKYFGGAYPVNISATSTGSASALTYCSILTGGFNITLYQNLPLNWLALE